MTKSEFIIRITKAKDWIESFKDGHFVCCALDMKLSPKAVSTFQELFEPRPCATIFFLEETGRIVTVPHYQLESRKLYV